MSKGRSWEMVINDVEMVSMKRVNSVVVGLAVVMAILSGNVYGEAGAGYWPMWRGPLGSGVVEKGNPPVNWSETENIKWKVEFPGEGTSSPIIWGDKIFFQTAIETDKKGGVGGAGGKEVPFHGGTAPDNVHKFNVVCMDRKSGEVLWQRTLREEQPHEGHHPDHGFASFSPVTDGKHVWVNFGSRGVHCFDVEGEVKWSKDFGKMKTRAGFGEGSSPAVVGESLIVVMDQDGDSFIYALNKVTGEVIWKKGRDELTNWATPVATEVDGKMQVIMSGAKFIRSYDLKTGDIVWQCSGMTQNVVPTPVVAFGRVYCASGFRGSALVVIELGRSGDLTGTDAIAWQVNKATPYVPSPLLSGGKIYVCSVNEAIVSCYDAKTGEVKFFKQRLEGLKGIYASPVAVAGRLYFVGRNGVTAVLKESDKIEVLATNTLDERIDASPAVVGDELYLKGKTHLYCIARP